MTELELARFRAIARRAIAVKGISLPDFDRVLFLSQRTEPHEEAEVARLVHLMAEAMRP